MIDRNLEVKVTNRKGCSVGYTIDEMGGLRRQFQPGETKILTYEELEKLSWIPGGKVLLDEYLIIQDPEVLQALMGKDVQPEYYYNEAEVKELLLNGTIAQFMDCLDFAPEGVLDLVKKLAVELPCNNMEKLRLIEEKLGFNVINAIDLMKEDKAETEPEVKPAETGKTGVRRSAPVTVAENSEAKAPRYTITK